MPKPIKILVFALALVLVVFAGLLSYILLVIDPNDYKPELEQLAKEQGVTLAFEGDLGWSLFPQLALRIGPTRISSPEHKLAPSTLAGAQLSLDWLPLLRRQIVVNALRIDGADIHLARAEQAAAVLGAPALADDSAGQDAKPPFALAFNQLILNDSRVSVQNGDGDPTVYDQISLKVQDLNSAGEPFPVQLALQYPLDDKALDLSLSGELAYHGSEQRVEIAALEIELANLLAEALKVSLAGTVDVRGDTASTSALRATLGGLTAEGSLQIAHLSSAPALAGQLKLSSANLKGDLQGIAVKAIATTNPNALKLFDLQMAYTASTDAVTLADIQLTLDSTHITGSGQLTSGDRRHLQLQLAGDNLNLDSYRAPQEAAAETIRDGEAVAGDQAIFAPLAGLLALLDGGKGDIQLAFDSLVTAETTFVEPKLTLKADGDKLKLAPLHFGLYDGTLDATVALDLASKPARLSIDLDASNLDLVAAQQQWADSANLQGRLAITLKGTTQGDTAEQLRNGLAAEGKLTIDKLRLASINLEQSYCELAQLVEKTPPREEPWPKGTDLTRLTSQFAVAGQTIQLQEYHTGVGNLGIRGDGTIRLDEEKFAIKVITRLTGDRTSDTGCAVKSKRVRDRDIPLLCKDRFAKADKSSCKPDPDFVKALLQKELLDKFIKPSEDGEEKPLEGLLKGLLNR